MRLLRRERSMLAAVMARAWRMRGSALGGCGGGGGGCIETWFILERRSLLDTRRLAVWGFWRGLGVHAECT